MSKRTIANFSVFVISTFVAVITLSSCSSVTSRSAANSEDRSSAYGPPKVIGKLASDEIMESSGIAASQCQPGVYWTHNDSGNGPIIFAINSSGDDLGSWKVTNAENNDWEDIAAYRAPTGECFLFIGDIGDNKQRRPEHAVYRVKEPQVSSKAAAKPAPTDPADSVRFKYPDGDHNSETLMVEPTTGAIYVATKRMDGPSAIYKIAPVFGAETPQDAVKIADLAVPNVPNGLLTGGDISPDGKRVVVCDYSQAYELVLPGADANFDDVWKQRPQAIDLGDLKQGEAVAYSADGDAIVATSEKKNSPFVEVKRTK